MKIKYVYPVSFEEENSIETVMASSYNDAQDKIMRHYIDDLEYDAPDDWQEFLDWMYERYIIIGEPIDIETL